MIEVEFGIGCSGLVYGVWCIAYGVWYLSSLSSILDVRSRQSGMLAVQLLRLFYCLGDWTRGLEYALLYGVSVDDPLRGLLACDETLDRHMRN